MYYFMEIIELCVVSARADRFRQMEKLPEKTSYTYFRFERKS